MAINFEALKKRSAALQKGGKSAITAYQNVFGQNDYTDDTFWKLTRGKNGNASAVIRFLPNPQGDVTRNFVRYYDHFFKVEDTNKYYIENSLTTFMITDPIGEYVKQLWQEAKFDPESEKLAKKYKRKTNFVSNILVIDDPEKPENNGKVFKFKYGVKIYDKIKEAIAPEFANQQPIDIFDPWVGANFNLRMKKDGEYYSYDSSSFDIQSTIGDDDYIASVLEQSHDLSYIAEQNGVYQGRPFYKTYDELVQSLIDAFGFDPRANAEEITIIEKKETTPAPKRKIEKPETKVVPNQEIDESFPWDDDDVSPEAEDDDEFFKMINE